MLPVFSAVVMAGLFDCVFGTTEVGAGPVLACAILDEILGLLGTAPVVFIEAGCCHLFAEVVLTGFGVGAPAVILGKVLVLLPICGFGALWLLDCAFCATVVGVFGLVVGT